MSDTLLLIDLSSIVHALWHQSSDQPDPGWTIKQAIAKVHALASAHQQAAVCCDSRRSFRKEADPTYKANRPQQEAPLTHQMAVTIEALRRDGFPVWIADGYEADDIIATAVKCAKTCQDAGDRVLIASADKDLLQLVEPSVSVHSLTSGNLMDEAAVIEKFGVRPDQMLDYLCLVGDTTDGVKGAEGIGAKRAVALLATFGTLTALYEAIDAQTAKLANGQAASLAEFRSRWPKVRELLRLRDDAPVPFEEMAAERAPRVTTTVTDMETGKAIEADVTHEQPVAATTAPTQALVAHAPQPDFSLQLEPRDFDEAMKLASKLWLAKGVNKFGCAEAVFMVIIAGRELGLPALASVRAFHWIESEPRPSADLLAGLVLKSGKARYFRSIARTREHAIFETQRGDDPPVQLECTIIEERAAYRKDQKAWDASGWGKTPADMLSARAKSKLARLVYPDVVGGLYSPEEFD